MPVPTAMTATRIPGLPVTYSLLTDDGRVYAVYASNQIELLRTEVRGLLYVCPKLTTLQMVRRGSVSSNVPSVNSEGRWLGTVVYPPPPASTEGIRNGMASLELEDTSKTPTFDKAMDAVVNGRFGLVAVGTER